MAIEYVSWSFLVEMKIEPSTIWDTVLVLGKMGIEPSTLGVEASNMRMIETKWYQRGCNNQPWAVHNLNWEVHKAMYIHIYVCMYVCMHACMYVYAYTYVSMYI